MNVLKEDRQAFGVLVGEVTTHKEVNLQQGYKAALRNYLIEESNSITEELPTRGNWLMMECLL